MKVGRPPFSLDDVGHSAGVRLVNRAGMVADPKGERIAVAFYSKNRLDIYSTDGDLLSTSSGPRETTTSFYIEDNRFFWDTEENELAYTSVAASDDEVFLLFCGCGMGEDDPNDPTYRRRIHVFGWDGEFRRELVLPITATRIAVDPEGTNLFTTAEDPWPVIKQWSLEMIR